MASDTFSSVDNYLSSVDNYDERNDETDNQIKIILSEIKSKAVQENNQPLAKKAWCYEKILLIQQQYLMAFLEMKAGHYYDAWCLLERIEIEINSLSAHYSSTDSDPYKLHLGNLSGCQ